MFNVQALYHKQLVEHDMRGMRGMRGKLFISLQLHPYSTYRNPRTARLHTPHTPPTPLLFFTMVRKTQPVPHLADSRNI
jgi:hypothetical protein